ncbi:MAG: UvrD-helicase domain-containing protein [Bdellovibrionota bacterium]
MTLSDIAKNIIGNEEKILSDTLAKIKESSVDMARRTDIEKERASELTKALVNAKTDEDRQLLASDESVSHSLVGKKLEQIDILHKQYDKPYFARFELEEEIKGQKTTVEYKLGFYGNTDCRIIDWRKAPISKLYYEYKEGEEFFEIIQGKERQGIVKLKNKLEIEKSVLNRISSSKGNFIKKDGSWEEMQGSFRSYEQGSQSYLPNVISLITAEQFQMITEDAKTAVLIQGVAGSGKTTVALHRLAWLLHEDNSDLKAHEVVVIVLHNSLKSFILETLPSMAIHNVRILTFTEWATETIKNELPELCRVEEHTQKTYLKIATSPCPISISRVKSSMAMLKSLESHLLYKKSSGQKIADPLKEILNLLANPEDLISRDTTKLISREIIKQSYERSVVNFQNNQIDESDIPLILRLLQIKNDGVYLPSRLVGKYKHIVVDEIQDFSATNLACIIGGVETTNDLTLVGDIAQSANEASLFPGWDTLKKEWNFRDSMSRYISLTVSHRSTLPIMKLADYVQNRHLVKTGRAGRTPIWFQSFREQKGLKAIINWLLQATEKYPSATTCVICRDAKEAKYAFSLLEPTFGSIIRVGDKDNFSFAEGIIVTEISEIKGLEFCNVVIWNPTTKSYPNDEISRNLLYIAITRAQENLNITTWGKPSLLLPNINSKLVRGVLLSDEILEEK